MFEIIVWELVGRLRQQYDTALSNLLVQDRIFGVIRCDSGRLRPSTCAELIYEALDSFILSGL